MNYAVLRISYVYFKTYYVYCIVYGIIYIVYLTSYTIFVCCKLSHDNILCIGYNILYTFLYAVYCVQCAFYAMQQFLLSSVYCTYIANPDHTPKATLTSSHNAMQPIWSSQEIEKLHCGVFF